MQYCWHWDTLNCLLSKHLFLIFMGPKMDDPQEPESKSRTGIGIDKIQKIPSGMHERAVKVLMTKSNTAKMLLIIKPSKIIILLIPIWQCSVSVVLGWEATYTAGSVRRHEARWGVWPVFWWLSQLFLLRKPPWLPPPDQLFAVYNWLPMLAKQPRWRMEISCLCGWKLTHTLLWGFILNNIVFQSCMVINIRMVFSKWCSMLWWTHSVDFSYLESKPMQVLLTGSPPLQMKNGIGCITHRHTV